MKLNILLRDSDFKHHICSHCHHEKLDKLKKNSHISTKSTTSDSSLHSNMDKFGNEIIELTTSITNENDDTIESKHGWSYQ